MLQLYDAKDYDEKMARWELKNTRWTKDNIDEHGYFYLADDSGNEAHPSSISFGIDEAGHTNYGNEYTEYIFDIERVNLEEQKLLGNFVSNGNYTTGNWNVTFKMQPVRDEVNGELDKNFGTWSSKGFSISPLGVTLYGNGTFNDSNEIDVSVKMTDGIVHPLDSMTSFSKDEKVQVKFIPSLPLDVTKIKSINIDITDLIKRRKKILKRL